MVTVAYPFVAQAQMSDKTVLSNIRFGDASVHGPRLQLAKLEAPRPARIYGRSAWSDSPSYYGNWRQSFSPYWALSVTTELVATAPVFYYYGVGHGDPYAYEVPASFDDAVAYCLRSFKSYDPASGTYIGGDGYRHRCP
jgi:hypothetical protein